MGWRCSIMKELKSHRRLGDHEGYVCSAPNWLSAGAKHFAQDLFQVFKPFAPPRSVTYLHAYLLFHCEFCATGPVLATGIRRWPFCSTRLCSRQSTPVFIRTRRCLPRRSFPSVSPSPDVLRGPLSISFSPLTESNSRWSAAGRIRVVARRSFAPEQPSFR